MKWLTDIDWSSSAADSRGGGEMQGEPRKYFSAVVSLLSEYWEVSLWVGLGGLRGSLRKVWIGVEGCIGPILLEA